MTYAIVTVENTPRREWPDELDFYIHIPPTDKGLRQIAESCWLINIDTDLLALSNIVRTAHKARMPVHAMFFPQKPDLISLLPSLPVSA